MEYPVDKSGVLNGEFHAGNLPGGFDHHNDFDMIYSGRSSNNNVWLYLMVIH
jgi:hypothetical protein